MLFFFFTVPPMGQSEYRMFHSNPASFSPQGKDLTSSDERQPLPLVNYILMIPQRVVTPVKTGVQRIFNWWKELDSGFRRNDGQTCFLTFYDSIQPHF
jgi:hypothetical protein